MQSAQRFLIFGILAGVLLGCILGSTFSLYYAWMVNPAVYGGGAYPNEMTAGYQDQYFGMAIDSYNINRQVVPLAQERLKSFGTQEKIVGLGEWSVAYTVNGRTVEAQAANELAAGLKQVENWSPEDISAAMNQLAAEAQGDPAKLQAINTYAEALGMVAQPTSQPAPGQTPPVSQPPPATATPEGGGLSWLMYLGLCLLGLLVLVAIVLLVGRLYQRRKKAAKPAPIAWEGEGPAPIKHWSGTYTLGQDNYDEFFTIETDKGDFLGESGMGIMEAIPGTSPKQVKAFDVGLFDKTDITTLSRVVMTESAYNDPNLRAKIEANPQAEAILAEAGKEFTLETSALRVAAKIEEMEYGPGNEFFNKLKMSLNVFIKEGADLKIGTMDIPDQYK
jgi:hypothetical protein